MSKLLRWLSLGLFIALSLFLVAFGLLYASVSAFLPFHSAAITGVALDAFLPLYMALMKLIGGASIAQGLLCLYVIMGPIRQGRAGAVIAVSSSYGLSFLMAAYVAETLKNTTQAPTSWHIMGILLTLTLAAVVLYFLAAYQNNKTDQTA
jgi:hypothetical protein